MAPTNSNNPEEKADVVEPTTDKTTDKITEPDNIDNSGSGKTPNFGQLLIGSLAATFLTSLLGWAIFYLWDALPDDSNPIGLSDVVTGQTGQIILAVVVILVSIAIFVAIVCALLKLAQLVLIKVIKYRFSFFTIFCTFLLGSIVASIISSLIIGDMDASLLLEYAIYYPLLVLAAAGILQTRLFLPPSNRTKPV